jgi:type III pantothenate kinase
MNLIIDIGNTSAKAALFNKNKLVSQERFSNTDFESISSFADTGKTDRAIISSVAENPEEVITMLKQHAGYVHHLTWESEFPFSSKYRTPETLGVDRLAAAAGAVEKYGKSNILIIDAGSAITIDLVTGGVYRGGNISPGMEMRFRALNTFTEKLPLCSYAREFTFPGISTSDAITGGVITGLTYELNEYIRTFRKEYRKLVVILTGGDSLQLTELIEHEIICLPNLVIEGLNYLLEYNYGKNGTNFEENKIIN